LVPSAVNECPLPSPARNLCTGDTLARGGVGALEGSLGSSVGQLPLDSPCEALIEVRLVQQI